MLKKFLCTALLSTMLLLMVGCNNSANSVGSTDAVNTDETESVVMDDEISVIEDNSSTEELIMSEFKEVKDGDINDFTSFINNNIEFLSEENADIVIINYMEKVVNLNNGLGTYEGQVKLEEILGNEWEPNPVENGIEDGKPVVGPVKEKVLECIISDSDRKYVQELFNNSLTVDQYEGSYFLIVDYNQLFEKYSGYVSEPLKEYLRIMKTETLNSLTNGEYLALSFEELGKRMVSYEEYLSKYGKEEYSDEILKLYETGLVRCIRAINYDSDGSLYPEQLTFFKDVMDSKETPILSEAVVTFLNFYEKQGSEITNENYEEFDLVSRDIWDQTLNKIKNNYMVK